MDGSLRDPTLKVNFKVNSLFEVTHENRRTGGTQRPGRFPYPVYEQRGLISAVERNAQLLAIETIESKLEGLTCDDNKKRVLKRFRKRSASL